MFKPVMMVGACLFCFVLLCLKPQGFDSTALTASAKSSRN